MDGFHEHFEGPILHCAELHQKWFTTTKSAEKKIKKNSRKQRKQRKYHIDDHSDSDSDDANSTDSLFYRKHHNMPFLQRSRRFKRTKQKFPTKRKAPTKEQKIINVIGLLSTNKKKKREQRKFTIDSPFPPYDPLSSGPPDMYNTAFALFSKCNTEKARHLSRENKSDKPLCELLLEMWEELSDEEILERNRNEEWDMKRYEHEKKLYIKAVFKPRKISANSLLNKKGGDCCNRINAIFYFVYNMIGENLPAEQICPIVGFKCPICHHPSSSAEKLIAHCTVHDSLAFEAVYDEDQLLHIQVTADESNNIQTPKSFQYFQNKPHEFQIPYVRRPITFNAELTPEERERITKNLTAKKAPQSLIEAYTLSSEQPIRQYYHSRTNFPILSQQEWEYDSDTSTDDGWIHTIRNDLLHDLEDVSSQEKSFMKLWNGHMTSNDIQKDKDIVEKCKGFIDGYDLMELRKEFLLHLLNLFQWGLVLSSDVKFLMIYFDSKEYDGKEDTTTLSLQNSTTSGLASNQEDEDTSEDEYIFYT